MFSHCVHCTRPWLTHRVSQSTKKSFSFLLFLLCNFYTVFQLLDADLRGRQLLRHGSAKFLNGLPHLATHVKVCGISLLCCLNQLFVMFFQLISQKQTLFVFTKLLKCFIVSKLLPSGLDSKISLPCRNDRFRGVAVLYYQVTGIAGEYDVFLMLFLAFEPILTISRISSKWSSIV